MRPTALELSQLYQLDEAPLLFLPLLHFLCRILIFAFLIKVTWTFPPGIFNSTTYAFCAVKTFFSITQRLFGVIMAMRTWIRSTSHLNKAVILLFIQPSLQNTHYADENTSFVLQSVEPCHIYGDPDLYGLGVRLSFYITWASLYVAIAFKASQEIRNARRSFNVVALAILINTYKSVKDGSFAALEVFIVCNLVLFLSFLFLLPFSVEEPEQDSANLVNTTNTVDTPASRKGTPRKDIFGLGMSALIHAIFLCSQPWLYFTVPRQGSKQGCDAKIWILWTVHISGNGWITFLKIVAVFSIPFAAIIVTAGLFALGWAIASSLTRNKIEQVTSTRVQEGHPGGQTSDTTSDPVPSSDATLWEGVKIFWGAVKRMGHFVVSAISWKIPFLSLYALPIAFVEKTIRINHIDLNNAPITSTSQLLPLLVAVFSALAVLWVSIWNNFPKAWKAAVEDWARGQPTPQRPDYPPWSAPFITAHNFGDWLHEDLPSSPLPTLRHPYQSYQTWSQGAGSHRNAPSQVGRDV